MSIKILKYCFITLYVSLSLSGYSQNRQTDTESSVAVLDSLRNSGLVLNEHPIMPEIILSEEQSIRFLKQRIQPHFWKNSKDPLRIALGQLVFEASNLPYDSSEFFLKKYPFDSLKVSWDKFYIWEPVRIKIAAFSASENGLSHDTIQATDTINKINLNDTSAVSELVAKGEQFRIKPSELLKDTSVLVVIDTLNEVTSDYNGFPFTYYSYPYQADSMIVAVKSLMGYLETRDSSIIYLTGLGDDITPVWLNSKSERVQRYWLKNDLNDSVTIWIGAASRNTLGLYLEQGVNFRRPAKQGNITEAKIDIKEVDKSKLLEVTKIIVKPQYWKYRTEALITLNQASLTNWVKGGESSISTALDITEFADYVNKVLKVTSNNYARLKYGLIASGNEGVRKNLDLLETNSKLNHKAFGKFDFSAIMLFKTQVAKGYNYPNDSVPVSKFMNPAILTAGIGLDYKPNKNTSINFSPISYKGTFVPDTTNIDQTKYGIAKDRKSLNEPGMSFIITHVYKPIKTVSITNRLQLFTNYIDHPQNVDIDWEMILTASINWFTEVRLNTHFIFDDNTKTPDPENITMKNARVQFKELLGFSFVFRF